MSWVIRWCLLIYYARTSRTGPTTMHWYTEIFYVVLLLFHKNNRTDQQKTLTNPSALVDYKVPEAASTLRRRNLKTQLLLFLRLGLKSTLIRQENGTFQKRSSNRRNLKTPAFRFRVDGKQFENEAFRKRWRHDNHVISLAVFSSHTSDRYVFKFIRYGGDGKHLMRSG